MDVQECNYIWTVFCLQNRLRFQKGLVCYRGSETHADLKEKLIPFKFSSLSYFSPFLKKLNSAILSTAQLTDP